MIICKLCKNNPPIQHSHVIPEFMYKPIYDDKHRFIPFTTEDSPNNKIEQKGYVEPLLCLSCETKFSKLEGTAAKFLIEIGKGNFIEKLKEMELYSSKNFDDTKRCILSILWRMSISSLPFFSFYKLNSIVEENLRLVFDQNLPIEKFKYPILLTRILLEESTCNDLMALFNEAGVYKEYPLYTIVVFGFIFDIIINETELSDDLKKHLDSAGKDHIMVRAQELSEIENTRNLLNLNSENNEKARKFYKLDSTEIVKGQNKKNGN